MIKIIALLFFGLSILTQAASIDDLIGQGRLGEAYAALELAYGDSPESSAYFLLSGLSSENGESSVSDLKDFINRGEGSPYMIDWARMHLGKYYISQGLLGTARKMFESVPEISPFAAEAAYLAGRCCLYSADFETAEKIFSDATKRFNPTKNKNQNDIQTEYYYWSVFGLGEAKSALGQNTAAEKLYKQLLEPQFESDIEPLALLGLAKTARQAKKPDQANQYMELYKERYGQAPVGEAHTSTANAIKSSKTPVTPSNPDERMDKIMGNKYYIQIGAYSKKNNADNEAAAYKKNGYKVLVESYDKQGQTFYRVLLGSYSSKSQADYIKSKLEKAAGEKYSLLVR
jgi:TolA-binding protein